MSHWLLDFIVHFPDLPLYPGNSPLVGLGLWSSTIGTQVIEGALFINGIILYLNSTVAINRAGKIIFWILIALLVFTHLSSLFAPAPSTVTELAWSAQWQWIFVLLGRQKQDCCILKKTANNAVMPIAA